MAVFDTTNFHIISADDPDSLARATAIYEGCEEDLANLERLFRTSFHTGITEKWPIWIFVQRAETGSAAANNYGYLPGQFMVINILSTYTPFPNTFPADPPISSAPTMEFNEHARVLLVAELSELLMTYTSLWNPGDNAGEALSNYLASLLHPMGYYPQAGSGGGSGPRIQSWLDSVDPQSPLQRPDWISTIEPTDKNFVSFGCGIAFLHYLVSQLNHPIEDVIQARDNPIYDTLAITYSKLTGNPVSQAFSDFSSLVNKHLPVGSQVSVGSDNVFPLLDSNQRAVFAYFSGMNDRPLPVNSLTTYVNPFESIEVKAGPACPPKRYSFYYERDVIRMTFTADCLGILNATFKFTVNDIQLPVIGQWAMQTVPTDTSFVRPDGTKTSGSAETIRYFIRKGWNSWQLFIENIKADGTFVLNIVASANETAISDSFVSSNTVSMSFAPLSYIFEDRYYKDQSVCRMDISSVHVQLKSLSTAIGNGYYGHSPTSPGYFVTILNIANQLEMSLAKLSGEVGRPRSEILKELVTTGSMPSIIWPLRNDLKGPISTRVSILPSLSSNLTNTPGEIHPRTKV